MEDYVNIRLSQADMVHQNIVFGLRSEIEAKAVLLAEAMEELAAARSSSRRRLFFFSVFYFVVCWILAKSFN